uniref:Reverse transcriptase/retrotransposon-derived protein RNase H-like domain-containing protein n=1 Tax=Varanus komodoensis TaxID=61221 RepID=A0A8D2KWF7_VARKO
KNQRICVNTSMVARQATQRRNAHIGRSNYEDTHEQAFSQIKQALFQVPVLALLDYSNTFNIFCHEQLGKASGVLSEEHGTRQRSVAYLSLSLDPISMAFPPSLSAMVTAAVLVRASELTLLPGKDEGNSYNSLAAIQ